MNKMIFRYLFLSLIILAFFFYGAKQADAHEIGYQAINTSLEAKGNEILLNTKVAFLFDYDSLDQNTRLATLSAYFAKTFSIEQNSQPCGVVIDNLVIDEKVPMTIFGGKYICPQEITNIGDLKISSVAFAEFFDPYDHFIAFNKDGNVSEIILTQDKQVYPEGASMSKINSPQQGQENLFAVIKRFTKLGIEHILLGVDHILFLLAVVLLLTSFKKVITLVTAFTVAHSITLIASVMGLVIVSPKLVEPVIALSIAAMAARNIWILKTKKKDHFKEKWAVVFGFGLFHGLGFAGALAKTEIPKQYFFPSLLSFNAGIEVGQLIILAVVLPCLILIRKWRFKSYTLYGVSIAITLISLFWFIERIVK